MDGKTEGLDLYDQLFLPGIVNIGRNVVGRRRLWGRGRIVLLNDMMI